MLNHSIDDMIAENVSIIPSFLCSEDVIIEAVWNGSEEGTSPIEDFFLSSVSLLAYLGLSVLR